jgi:NADPH:quinone reductase-like Zn-dependent oxidoreductase
MKAIVYTKYGSPDFLELRVVDKPVPKDNEVLIKVFAASINDWDLGNIIGRPFINRFFTGLFKPKKNIPGSDISGRIEAIGKNVNLFQAGDEVYGDLSGIWGGFAEYACAHEKAIAFKPPKMTFEEAAAIPQAAMLALQSLHDIGQINQGIIERTDRQKILINGAGGGVGTFGIQIAKLNADIEVTGVDSTDKLNMLRSIGFDHVIDYTREDFTKNRKCYDLILDVKTNRSIFDYLRALNPNGIYVTVGGSMSRLLQIFLLRPVISMFSNKKINIVALKPNRDLVYINELFEAGKIKPILDKPFNLSDVPEAMKYFSKGVHKGKIVITIEHNINT